MNGVSPSTQQSSVCSFFSEVLSDVITKVATLWQTMCEFLTSLWEVCQRGIHHCWVCMREPNEIEFLESHRIPAALREKLLQLAQKLGVGGEKPHEEVTDQINCAISFSQTRSIDVQAMNHAFTAQKIKTIRIIIDWNKFWWRDRWPSQEILQKAACCVLGSDDPLDKAALQQACRSFDRFECFVSHDLKEISFKFLRG
jgi:hypothetical protein